jgi:hypothetical protein
MPDREKQQTTVEKFKRSIVLTVSSFLILMVVGIAMRGLPTIAASYSYQLVSGAMVLLLICMYIYSLVVMYKMAVVLDNAQLLKVKPWLLLLLAIVATPIGFFVNIIIVIVLWKKANALPK